MDGDRFDELSKFLSSRFTRKRVVRGLAGLAAAGVSASSGRNLSAAQPACEGACELVTAPCPPSPDNDCKCLLTPGTTSGTCVICSEVQICDQACCSAEESCCFPDCVSTASLCPDCENVCADTETCCDGVACVPTADLCGGICGNVCASTETCCADTCIPATQCCTSDDCAEEICATAVCSGGTCTSSPAPNSEPGPLCDAAGETCCTANNAPVCCRNGEVCAATGCVSQTCVPDPIEVACAGMQCGPVDNGCGVDYQCGLCGKKRGKNGKRDQKQLCVTGVCKATGKKRCLGKGLAGQPCGGKKCKCDGGRRCHNGRCCETTGDGTVHCNANSDCCPGLMCARRPGQHKVCLRRNAKEDFTESEAAITPASPSGEA